MTETELLFLQRKSKSIMEIKLDKHKWIIVVILILLLLSNYQPLWCKLSFSQQIEYTRSSFLVFGLKNGTLLFHIQVVELSEPTCPGLQESINSVAHGLLATLSPKIHTKAPLQSENTTSTSTLNIGKDDCPELVENTSLQFQPLISISRDYLARLLFW